MQIFLWWKQVCFSWWIIDGLDCFSWWVVDGLVSKWQLDPTYLKSLIYIEKNVLETKNTKLLVEIGKYNVNWQEILMYI